ncbi:MAG: DUF2752 domain-containing protein [Clostridia bacterium]|nr:DUF2752 domain-containing protein [Clostridia bacterium]
MYFFLVTGRRCPICGVSRALNALLKGNYSNYFYYQPFALLLLIAIWLMCHIKLFNNKKGIKVFVYSVVIINFVYYILNL